MDPIIGGALISGGLGLLGGAMSAKAQKDQAAENIALQREFAQNGIRWKVADAKAAGIHPLYALGANTSSFSPISTGDTSLGSSLSNMGQDIGRAVAAGKTATEKELATLQIASARADVEGKALDNQIRAKQLADLNSKGPPGPGTSYSIPGQTSSGVEVKPLERVASPRGHNAQEIGSISDVGYAVTPHGLTPVPSKDVKERIEDQFVPETMWAIRNYAAPNLGGGAKPTLSEVRKTWPDATGVYWSHVHQTWRPEFSGSVRRKRLFFFNE